MSILKQNLRKGEIVIEESSVHCGVFLFPAFFILFYLIFLVNHSFVAIINFPWLIVFVYPAVSKYFFTELSLSNKRLVGKVGIIRTVTLDNPLLKINSISVSSGLFGKILGYGNICVNTAGSSMVFRGIKNPQDFANKINHQLNELEN